MGIQEDLLQSMWTIAESSVDNASFNKTRKCQIIGVGNNNTYSIRLDGIEYPNIPVYGDNTFSVGDIVRVEIPCNEPSQMCIIPPGSISTDWNNIANKPSTFPPESHNHFDENGNLNVPGNIITKGHDSHVGTIVSDYSVSAKALASGTSWVDSTCKIFLTEGTWIIFASCYMSAPSGGTINTRRGMRLYSVTRAIDLGYISNNIIEAGNATSCPHATCPQNIQAGGETIRLEVYQNSGKSLNIYPRLFAIRIA